MGIDAAVATELPRRAAIVRKVSGWCLVAAAAMALWSTAPAMVLVAIAWLLENVWKDAPRIRLDVLVGNSDGIKFWRSLGFADYCVTMEKPVK